MAITKITTPKVAEPAGGIYSNCLVVGDQVFLSGIHSGGPDGKPVGGDDPYLQTVEIYKRIEALLAAAGASKHDIVKQTTYITDIAWRPGVGKARNEFFPEPRPCSTLVVVVGLAGDGIKVEIDVTAIRGASGK